MTMSSLASDPLISTSNDLSMELSVEASHYYQLAEIAEPVLLQLIELSQSANSLDLQLLHQKLVNKILDLERAAKLQSVPAMIVLTARYLLCTALDEVIFQKIAQQGQSWSKYSLLSMFHEETWGGEKFFVLLERFLVKPYYHRDLLELMFFLLSLGFQGKYRLQEDGEHKLIRLRNYVYDALLADGTWVQKPLGVDWLVPKPARDNKLRWGHILLLGTLAIGMVFSTFKLVTLNKQDPVERRLQTIIEQLS